MTEHKSTVWELGISLRQWHRIADYAKRHGRELAAATYGVPVGAVEDALAGRWERID